MRVHSVLSKSTGKMYTVQVTYQSETFQVLCSLAHNLQE